MLEQGKNVKSPPPAEEGAAERMCDELAINPVPHSPVLLGWRRWRNQNSSLGRMKGWEEGVLKIWMCFLLPYTDLIGSKLN